MVNINEFEAPQVPSFGLLDNIFSEQHSLMEKYIGIEADNHLLHTPDCPVDLDSPKGQARLKDFAWRITEELGEALEACRVHPDLPDHNREELIDSLHFLTEFTILAGVTVERFDAGGRDKLDELFSHCWVATSRQHTSLYRDMGRTVGALAVACNCLKNKPWKNTQMMTDVDYFTQKVVQVWFRFAELCQRSGIDSQKLFNLYFRKSEVNKFRQRSNY